MSLQSRCLHGTRALLLALLLTSLTAPDAVAQFSKLKEKVKKATDDVANQVDPAKAPPAPAPAPAASAEPAAAPAAAPAPAAGAGAAAPAPAAKEWANYDFVPGNRVIFDDDFTDDKVGNFPQRLEFGTGQMEVVELDGVRMLKASDRSTFIVPLKEPLPERYTIEVDFLSKNGAWEALELSGGRATYAGQRHQARRGRPGRGALHRQQAGAELLVLGRGQEGAARHAGAPARAGRRRLLQGVRQREAHRERAQRRR